MKAYLDHAILGSTLILFVCLNACGTSTNVGNPAPDKQNPTVPETDQKKNKTSVDDAVHASADNVSAESMPKSGSQPGGIMIGFQRKSPTTRNSTEKLGAPSEAVTAATHEMVPENGAESNATSAFEGSIDARISFINARFRFDSLSWNHTETQQEHRLPADNYQIDWLQGTLAPAASLTLPADSNYNQTTLTTAAENTFTVAFTYKRDDGRIITINAHYDQALSLRYLSPANGQKKGALVIDNDGSTWFDNVDLEQQTSAVEAPYTLKANAQLAEQIFYNMLASLNVGIDASQNGQLDANERYTPAGLQVIE